MEATNNPSPQEEIKKLTRDLENTKKLFQQKTAAANELQIKSDDLEKTIIQLQTKIDELTITLTKAKEKLFEQRDTLEALTREPLPLATVIKTYMNDPGVWADHGNYFKDNAGHNEYKIGLIVRIRPESERVHESIAEGEIKAKPKRGWVTVEFTDGKKGDYCTDDLLLKDRDAMDRDRYGTAVLYFEGRLVEVIFPKHLHGKLSPGDMVRLSPSTKQIVDKTDGIVAGNIGIITEIIDNECCEVAIGSGKSVAYKGRFPDVKKGDRVVLDPFSTIIIRNLGNIETSYTLNDWKEVSWDDIGGLSEAKRIMREIIEGPHQFRKFYEFYNKKPVKGALLFGPPGCGKTLLAMAIVTAIARMYGINAREAMQSGFIYVKGPELLEMWLGKSEEAIRSLFARAKTHKKKYGFPAIIFIDEAEALLRKRGSGISSDIESTTVPTFLAEMGGMEESSALVLLATNRADILDPAVVRDGRVDVKVYVSRPTLESAGEIFAIHLKGVPLADDLQKKDIAASAAKRLFSDEYKYYTVTDRKDPKTPKYFLLKHIVNGALIAGIVDKATTLAIRRDSGHPEKNPGGVKEQDLLDAIDAVFKQNIGLDHEEPMNEFIENEGIEAVGMDKYVSLKSALS
ncbi:MAG: AAA family ATPase [Bacteroidia bacterium]|nr:AAA family ATPase [Bacteroidia bacterium]